MLNEQHEYRLYLTKDYGGLFRRDNIGNGLNGIRHILTILARGFIDLCVQEGVTDVAQQTAFCQDFLICWLNGKYTLPHDVPRRLQEEFATASDCSLLAHIVRNNIKLSEANICSKISAWKTSMFFSKADNSANAIYFTAIIADALHQGPLTDRVLILKTNTENHGIVCTPEAVQYLNRVLAMVAVCLQHIPTHQTSGVITNAQLTNYLNISPSRKDKSKSIYTCIAGYVDGNRFTYCNQPILSKQEVIRGVDKKVLNRQWLKDYDVRLVDRDVKVPPNYTVYDDNSLLPKRFTKPDINRSTHDKEMER